MHGIGGYQQGLQYQDGLYGGLMVKPVSGVGNELKVSVTEGLARVGNTLIEQTPAGAATTITLADNATSYIYVNHPDALASYPAGAATATFDKTKEGDVTHTNINGSTGKTFGRSIVLAKVVTSGGAITSIDNTERLKLSNIPSAMWSQNNNA